MTPVELCASPLQSNGTRTWKKLQLGRNSTAMSVTRNQDPLTQHNTHAWLVAAYGRDYFLSPAGRREQLAGLVVKKFANYANLISNNLANFWPITVKFHFITHERCTFPSAQWYLKKVVPPFSCCQPVVCIFFEYFRGHDFCKETLMLSFSNVCFYVSEFHKWSSIWFHQTREETHTHLCSWQLTRLNNSTIWKTEIQM